MANHCHLLLDFGAFFGLSRLFCFLTCRLRLQFSHLFFGRISNYIKSRY